MTAALQSCLRIIFVMLDQPKQRHDECLSEHVIGHALKWDLCPCQCLTASDADVMLL